MATMVRTAAAVGAVPGAPVEARVRLGAAGAGAAMTAAAAAGLQMVGVVAGGAALLRLAAGALPGMTARYDPAWT